MWLWLWLNLWIRMCEWLLRVGRSLEAWADNEAKTGG